MFHCLMQYKTVRDRLFVFDEVGGYALFNIGNPPTFSAHTLKYAYLTETSTSGADITIAVANNGAAGNSTTGLFSGGNNASGNLKSTSKYDYATDTTVIGTSLARVGVGAIAEHSGASNETVAIMAGGTNSAGGTLTSDKYTYADDTCVAGTSLSITRYRLAAAGNATRALFIGGTTAGGFISLTSDKYTYSGDTVASGGALTETKNQYAACGIATEALFAGGRVGQVGDANDVTNLYDYSSDIAASGTSLTMARRTYQAASNPTYGLFAGGVTNPGNTYAANSDKYTFSSAVMAVAAGMSSGIVACAGVSSVPGGL